MKKKKNATPFVRNAFDKQNGARFSLLDSFKCAGSGLVYIFQTQRNLKIHTLIALFALIAGFLLSLPLSSWIAILICIGSVFTTECINTALETTIDLVSPDYSELAKRAKDCAAAAVLVCAVISIIVGVLVYGSAIVSLVG